LPGYVLL